MKTSYLNKEFSQVLNTMNEQPTHLLADYIVKYSDRLVSDVKSFLSRNTLTSLINSDVGCYDAVVLENGTELFVEATLDSKGHLEDCYCTCNTGFCIHLAAVLWKINEELKLKTAHQRQLFS